MKKIDTAPEAPVSKFRSGEGFSHQPYIAPGRVNLMGEHTDYTGGLVLPMAIPFFSAASITSNDDPLYEFTSDHFATRRHIAPTDTVDRTGEWSDYCVGVLQQLRGRGIEIAPFKLHITGNVPIASGLSSSASIEVAAMLALLGFARETMSIEEIARLCRRAENEFVGSPCGIMDQFVIVAAQVGHALLLDTETLRYEHLPLNGDQFAKTRIIIVNSMLKHSIAAGDYGVRRSEVELGQGLLKDRLPQLAGLGHATLEQLEGSKQSMPSVCYRRCRHIISENNRVRKAKDAILLDNPGLLGDLMVRSHASQRDDFACSREEIDFLVDWAIEQPGCFGARLTGGGFGGCTVNLVAEDCAEAFVAAVTRGYRDAYHLEAVAYICAASAGAAALNIYP